MTELLEAGRRSLTPLESLLVDPTVEEVWVNGPDRVFVSRRGLQELTPITASHREVEELVERLLAASGRRLDRSEPFVDARLADGSRLHVAIPPITAEHWAVNIRRFVGLDRFTLPELVVAGSLSRKAASFLEASVRVGLNVVVAGPVGSGKTTLLNCLASAIPPSERVVVCEEVFELQIDLPDVVSLQCRQSNLEGRGEVSLRRLVRETLRMRPDRIIIGEVRGGEAFDLLLALNSGAGGMTSVHANSAREALRKLVTLPLLAADNVRQDFVEPTVAGVVDLVVFTRKLAGGRRVVEEILGVSEQVGENGISAGALFRRTDDGLEWTGELPRRVERYAARGIVLREILR